MIACCFGDTRTSPSGDKHLSQALRLRVPSRNHPESCATHVIFLPNFFDSSVTRWYGWSGAPWIVLVVEGLPNRCQRLLDLGSSRGYKFGNERVLKVVTCKSLNPLFLLGRSLGYTQAVVDLGPESCSLSTTTWTIVLKASISSSTVPPIPALAKLIELVT